MSLNTMHKAAMAFAKHSCDAENRRAIVSQSGPRFGIMGAKRYHHPDDPEGVMRQYIVDGAVGVSYTTPFDDLYEVEPECVIPDITRIFPSGQPVPFIEQMNVGKFPDLKTVKALWRESRKAKATLAGINNRYRLAMDEDSGQSLIVDIEKLIWLMEITDSRGGDIFHWSGGHNPLYVERWIEFSPTIGSGLGVEGCLYPLYLYGTEPCLND